MRTTIKANTTNRSYLINGKKPLNGKVQISGAKNSVLKLMASSILTDHEVIIKNIPEIADVATMRSVLMHLGLEVEHIPSRRMIRISPTSRVCLETPYELVRRMRASFIVLGPLVAKFGKAKVAMPGGCNIGLRKIDLHLKGLEQLGAKISVGDGFIQAIAEKLTGSYVYLDFPSVGATENVIMAAVLADGSTLIENAAREPEIIDLCNFLTKLGAKIRGAGTSTIEIKGVTTLNGVEHEVIGDRVEAATYMIAAATTGGAIAIENIEPVYLGAVIEKLKETGVEIDSDPNRKTIRISSNHPLASTDIATLPFPGFPTDVQAQMMVLLSLCKGESTITENVFENRFLFVHELNRMGADIKIESHFARIKGVKSLAGCTVKATDLRAGAALVIAGLAAKGRTRVDDIFHIERGYGDLTGKFRSLGADISEVG